jgi:UDP-N-acetylglucosamine:LPS N-acetylglucosamine transferase
MTYRVLLVGGGTGGHVYPLVAVAKALQSRATQKGVKIRLLMMGDGPIFARAAKENGIRYTTILAPKLRRYTSAGNIFDILKVPIALVQSLWKLFWFMPDAVFAKGGYTCAFPTLAARLYMIPVYLHESDSVPGLANRVLSKRSRLVFTSFASADHYFTDMGRTTMLVGNPFRSELCCIDHAQALQALQLDPAKKTVLIIGGSLGAQQLNDLVLNGLVQLVQKGYQVIHQTGDKNFDADNQYGLLCRIQLQRPQCLRVVDATEFGAEWVADEHRCPSHVREVMIRTGKRREHQPTTLRKHPIREARYGIRLVQIHGDHVQSRGECRKRARVSTLSKYRIGHEPKQLP